MQRRVIPDFRDNPRFKRETRLPPPEDWNGGPLRIDLVGLDEAGKLWRAWGTYRRVEYWSECALPQSLLGDLIGKKFRHVIEGDEWLSPLSNWIVKHAASDNSGLLLVCWPPHRLDDAPTNGS